MYKIIKKKADVLQVYTDKLLSEGRVTEAKVCVCVLSVCARTRARACSCNTWAQVVELYINVRKQLSLTLTLSPSLLPSLARSFLSPSLSHTHSITHNHARSLTPSRAHAQVAELKANAHKVFMEAFEKAKDPNYRPPPSAWFGSQWKVTS